MDRIETFYRAMPPIIQTAFLCGLLAAFALIVMCFLGNKWMKISLFAIALLCSVPALQAVLAYHPELVDNRFRTYKEFFADLHPGMNHDDILFTEQKYYPSGGERELPKLATDSPALMIFYMSPEDEKGPLHECITITLDQGRIIGTKYSRDD
ncbi:hypothetical protein BH09VER1_BH09VER1_48430 [soil metagenome]